MVAPGVAVTVLEASLDWQEKLIEEAVNQEDETAIEADPYGMAVWPAGQVLAQAAAAWATTEAREWSETNAPLRAVEVGCGCGLASLALLSLKVHVTATDFRSLPLELLAESAQRQGLSEHLTLRRFDVRDTSAALPDADLVMASDVLYDRRTAAAMAVRADEALRRGAAVLVADIGRPNRKVFLERLRQLRPQDTARPRRTSPSRATALPPVAPPRRRPPRHAWSCCSCRTAARPLSWWTSGLLHCWCVRRSTNMCCET